VRDTFIKTLTELAEKDERIFLITGDLGFGVLETFARRFPKQFLNAGVAEQNMTGLATGLAMEGRIAFTYSIANFPILRCLEQIRNDAAYHGANVKVVSIGGGFSYGALGMSHHATEDIAIMRALPEVSVLAPCDHWETAEATRAVAAAAGVCYLRLDKSVAPATNSPDEAFSLGRARIVKRGMTLAVVACGGILGEVLTAADIVERQGIRPTVVSMHTVKPIDCDIIRSLTANHDAILTVEEHGLIGGLGSAVAEVLADGGRMPKRFRRLGVRDKSFVSIVGSQQYLRKHLGLDAPAIAKEILELTASLD
jgi:transketolase